MIPKQFAHLPPLVTIPIAAKAVGVSRRTLYNWMNAGKIEFVYTASRQRRIVTETLWKAAGEVSTAPVTAATTPAGKEVASS
jgi:excisionase family DNA binding protein